jgi:hypothetical protein
MSKLRCYLSYSPDTDISVIKNILTERNILSVSPLENSEYGNAILVTINRQIKDSDFIIAVLDDNINVSFEIGLAMGNKKPVFLITPYKNENKLPVFLNSVTYTLANPNEYEKIKFSFDFFLDNLPMKRDKIVSKVLEKKPNVIKKLEGKILSPDFVKSLGTFENMSGIQFEETVGLIFKKLNVEIFEQNRNKVQDFQADFSLWIDELNSIVGNPIIVETKSISSQISIINTVERLANYLKKYNSKAGLLIYNNPSRIVYSDLTSYAPLVISISIQELLQELTKKPLAKIILQLRNKAVHKI